MIVWYLLIEVCIYELDFLSERKKILLRYVSNHKSSNQSEIDPWYSYHIMLKEKKEENKKIFICYAI